MLPESPDTCYTSQSVELNRIALQFVHTAVTFWMTTFIDHQVLLASAINQTISFGGRFSDGSGQNRGPLDTHPFQMANRWAVVMVPMFSDPSHTRSPMRNVPESLRSICAVIIHRVYVKKMEGEPVHVRTKSFNDAPTNRSTIVQTVSGKLCRTTLLSGKSVHTAFGNIPHV